MAHVILSNGETVDGENPQVEIPAGETDVVTVEMGETESGQLVITKPEGARGKVVLTQGEATADITDARTIVFVNGGTIPPLSDSIFMMTQAARLAAFSDADLDALKALISS